MTTYYCHSLEEALKRAKIAGKRPGCQYCGIVLRNGKKGFAVYKDGIVIELYSVLEGILDRKACFPNFFLFLSIKAFHVMNTNESIQKKEYAEPRLRVISATLETSFLQSNLEPIDGGDDPDIDW